MGSLFSPFSSKSSSSSSTSVSETGQQSSDFGRALNFSNISMGDDDNRLELNISETDHGSVAAALQAADNAVLAQERSSSAALEFGGGAVNAIRGAQSDAYEFSAGAVGKSMELADGAMTLTAGAASKAMDTTLKATDNALAFSAGVAGRAFDSADTSRDQAFAFGAGAFQSATAAMLEGQRVAADLQKQAVNVGAAGAHNALEFGAGAFSQALQFADVSRADVVTVAKNAYDASAQRVSQFAETAIDEVTAAQQSEATKSFEMLVKVAAGLGALAVIAVVWKGK